MKAIAITVPSVWPNRLRKIHKWLSLVVGVQLVIWMLSGLYMASIDIEIIHGDHLTKPPSQPIDYNRVVPLPASINELNRVTLTTQLQQPVYLVQTASDSFALNASTGTKITIDQAYIRALAKEKYRLDGSIIDVVLLSRYPDELGARSQPIWQVLFNDNFSPTLYFSPQNGQLIKARSDLWRIFDLMWVLHIMDYQEGEDVNNNLLTISILLALFAACSGAWLMFYSFNKRSRATGFVAKLRQIHKWLALIVGVQLILWVISGLVFNLIQADKLHLKSQLQPQIKQPILVTNIDFEQINASFPSARQVTINASPHGPIVSFLSISGHPSVRLDTLTPRLLTPILAKQTAQQVYSNASPIDSSVLIKPGHLETRKLNRALWQINYQDNEHTSLYLDALTGKALDIKTDNWRLKDWFWMLHIMDYSLRSNFNSPLLITFSSLASLAALSGLLMLFWVFSRRDFGIKARKSQFSVQVTGAHQPHAYHLVNGHQPLLHAMKEQGVELSSGCGGNGTCCQCMVHDVSVKSPLTSQEQLSLSLAEINQGCRLACQLQVVDDLSFEIVPQTAVSQTITSQVVSSEFKTPLIKEIVLSVPPQHEFIFHAGQCINVNIPPFSLMLSQQMAPNRHQDYWHQQRLIDQKVASPEPLTRSYSIASDAGTPNTLALNVKLAPATNGFSPGLASSYLCSLQVGDSLSFDGPIGNFTTSATSTQELVLIGGGAGMAPLKSHIDTLLTQSSGRTMSLWFGVRTNDDVFYSQHFDRLAATHANFSWHLSLSQPPADNSWHGNSGYIQQALFSQHLAHHKDLTNIEFLLCGPASMMRDIRQQLLTIGVSDTAIKSDYFT